MLTAATTANNTLNSRDTLASVPASPLDLLPGKLIIRQYCHGEVKITLTAGTRLGQKRQQYLQALRDPWAGWHPPLIAHGWKFEDGVFNAKVEAVAGLEATLDSPKKFPVPIDTPYKFRKLPTRKIFSRYARTAIGEASQVCEEWFGKQGVFLTWTFPGKGEKIARMAAKCSGSIVAWLKQWVRDHVQGRHAEIGVWELQRRGMLHFHMAVYADDIEGLQYLLDNMKTRWAVLLRRLAKETGVNFCQSSKVFSRLPEGPESQQDGDWIKTSLAQYLAKYVSKGSRSLASQSVYHPTRWWSVSRNVASEAKSRRVKFSLSGCNFAAYRTAFETLDALVCDFAHTGFKFQNPFQKDIPGLIGWISPENISAWLAVLEENLEQIFPLHWWEKKMQEVMSLKSVTERCSSKLVLRSVN